MGPQEEGVQNDLAILPPSLAQGAIAAAALGMAREIDEGTLPPRESIAARGQIRQCMTVLYERAPGGDTGDKTDDKQARRERLLRVVPDQP